MKKNRGLTTGRVEQGHGSGDTGSSLNALLASYASVTGRELLDRILEAENPALWVESLSFGDFFWLIKKIGNDDTLPLLSLATDDQWQHLLDMEIWDRDHLDEEKAMVWLQRLYEADRQRTVRWLLSDGYEFACLCLKKYLQVLVVEEDEEPPEIPEGYFTHDGVVFLGVSNEAWRPFIEEMTKRMAGEHPARYWALLQALPVMIASEAEEELYHRRSTRVAEQGFLPFEEALEVLSPLDERVLAAGAGERVVPIDLDEEEIKALVPLLPLYQAEKGTLFEKALKTVADPGVMDRIRLEFAGICNALLALETPTVEDPQDLVRVCREAAGYLNLAMERICEGDPERAGGMMRANPLLWIHRVGFGYLLKLRWKAEQWKKKSWFDRKGLSPVFWGEDRGGVLAALLLKKPMLFQGLEAGEPVKCFEHVEELERAERILEEVIALDRLCEAIAQAAPPEESLLLEEELTYRHLIFEFWSRRLIERKPSMRGISMEEAGRLFTLLRSGEKGPPYRMPGFGEAFVNDLMTHAAEEDPALRTILASIWEDFRRDCERVASADLERVISRFFLIR